MKTLFEKIFPAQNIVLTEEWMIKMKMAISQLPGNNAVVCELYYIRQKPRKQIASDLGWSIGKVNQKITRGITLLKLQLNPEYFRQADEIIQETAQRLLMR